MKLCYFENVIKILNDKFRCDIINVFGAAFQLKL